MAVISRSGKSTATALLAHERLCVDQNVCNPDGQRIKIWSNPPIDTQNGYRQKAKRGFDEASWKKWFVVLNQQDGESETRQIAQITHHSVLRPVWECDPSPCLPIHT